MIDEGFQMSFNERWPQLGQHVFVGWYMYDSCEHGGTYERQWPCTIGEVNCQRWPYCHHRQENAMVRCRDLSIACPLLRSDTDRMNLHKG